MSASRHLKIEDAFAEANAVLETLYDEAASRPLWAQLARPEQIPPPGEWRVWLIMPGRGFGKTRTGAETFLQRVRDGERHLAVIAPTFADGRDVCVEGPAGILTCALPGEIETWNRSMGELRFASGARAKLFSADEPERLRGPQHGFIWGDEPGAWTYAESTYDMAMFGLRLGRQPQMALTTTPKAGNALIARLLSARGVAVTRGRTRDNYHNLAPGVVDDLEARYAGTRLGLQELEGVLLEDVEGALWRREWFDREGFRLSKCERDPRTGRFNLPEEIVRVVVSVDPSVSDPELTKNPYKDADACGLVVVGHDARGHGYLLRDYTAIMVPQEWAKKAAAAFRAWQANAIVYEQNQGGALVRDAIASYAKGAPVLPVVASLGKRTRAEPIALLYEKKRFHHCGDCREMEDQMCGWNARNPAAPSPNNVDALVHGATWLGLTDFSPHEVSDRFLEPVRDDEDEFLLPTGLLGG